MYNVYYQVRIYAINTVTLPRAPHVLPAVLLHSPRLIPVSYVPDNVRLIRVSRVESPGFLCPDLYTRKSYPIHWYESASFPCHGANDARWRALLSTRAGGNQPSVRRRAWPEANCVLLVAGGAVMCISLPASEGNLAKYDPRGMRVILPSIVVLGSAYSRNTSGILCFQSPLVVSCTFRCPLLTSVIRVAQPCKIWSA